MTIDTRFSGSLKLDPSVTKKVSGEDVARTVSFLQRNLSTIQQWPEEVQLIIKDSGDKLTKLETTLRETNQPKKKTDLKALSKKINDISAMDLGILSRYTELVFQNVSTFLNPPPPKDTAQIVLDKDLGIIFHESMPAVKEFIAETLKKKTLPPHVKVAFQLHVGPGGRNESVSYAVSAKVEIGDHKLDYRLLDTYKKDNESPLQYVQRVVNAVQELSTILA